MIHDPDTFATAARLDDGPPLPPCGIERAERWLSRRTVPAALIYAVVVAGILLAGLVERVPS